MNKFQAGDKIVVYADGGRYYGQVASVSSYGDKVLHVKLEGLDDKICAHPKQCRRLKKKQGLRVWVNYYNDNDLGYAWRSKEEADRCQDPERRECIEFIEVKRKK